MSIVQRGGRVSGSIGKDTKIQETWNVLDQPDRDSAIADLFAEVPAINGGLLLVGSTYENYSPDGWEFTVQWGAEGAPIEDELKVSLETEEVMVRVQQSLAEKASVVLPGMVDVPSNRFIGLKEDGDIEGVEVPTMKASAKVEVYRQAAIFTPAYAYALLRLKNVVNNAPWKGFAAGELRFKKGYFEHTRKKAANDTVLQRMVLEYEWEETVTNLIIGNLPPLPIKWGHDVVDIIKRQKVATVNGTTVRLTEAIGAKVHQVCPYAAYTVFGLGS